MKKRKELLTMSDQSGLPSWDSKYRWVLEQLEMAVR